MKRPYSLNILVIVTFCLFGWDVVQADIITLKSDEKVEGKVLSENDSSITIEYKLTPKIKDTKVINKADIKEIVRQSDALLEFADRGLGKILPTGDLMSAAEYEAIIQDKLRTFAAKYPGTPETLEVEKIIATLGEEKTKVRDGQVKMMGKWVDANSAKRDSYNIEAYRCLLAMRVAEAKIKDDHYINALREFDKMRTQYPASLHYVISISEANDILDKYEKQLGAMIAEQPILAKQREDGLKLITGADLQLTKDSIDTEVANFKAVLDVQTKQKTKWRDVYKYDAKSLRDPVLIIAKERAELKNIDLVALQSENEILTSVLRYLADNNAAEAVSLLATLNKDKLINKVVYATIEKQIKSVQDLLKKKKSEAVVTASTAKPDAVEEDPAKMAANPLAEALKKQQEDKDKKITDVSKKEDPKSAVTSKAKPKTKPTSSTATAATSSTPAPAEEEGLLAKISDYLPIVGGLILAVLLGAIYLGKKKKKQE